jgi:hypothetical protein
VWEAQTNLKLNNLLMRGLADGELKAPEVARIVNEIKRDRKVTADEIFPAAVLAASTQLGNKAKHIIVGDLHRPGGITISGQAARNPPRTINNIHLGPNTMSEQTKRYTRTSIKSLFRANWDQGFGLPEAVKRKRIVGRLLDGTALRDPVTNPTPRPERNAKPKPLITKQVSATYKWLSEDLGWPRKEARDLAIKYGRRAFNVNNARALAKVFAPDGRAGILDHQHLGKVHGLSQSKIGYILLKSIVARAGNTSPEELRSSIDVIRQAVGNESLLVTGKGLLNAKKHSALNPGKMWKTYLLSPEMLALEMLKRNISLASLKQLYSTFHNDLQMSSREAFVKAFEEATKQAR